MFKIFNMLLATFAILAVATACDENEIGSSVIDSESYLIVDSSFTLQGSSVASERIQSRTLTQLLGAIRSNEFGELRSDFVTEFMPASVFDTTGVSLSDIDSINIAFKVPMGSYTGDSLAPMRVSVYRLNKNLPYPIYSDFNPSEYYRKEDLLGSKSYAMSTLNQDSALYYKYDANGIVQVVQMIVVGLPKSLGTDLFRKYKTEPEIFKDPASFSKYFPGIYATTSYGDGRVIKITETTMNLFYKKHGKTEEDKDTVYDRVGSYFGVSPEIVTNNNISLKPSESINKLIQENGTAVIMAPAGYEASIIFPARGILDKFRTLSQSGQTVLNKVTMEIPASTIPNGQGIAAPKYLLLIKASEKDSFFKENKLPDNETSFYAQYNAAAKSYTFTGIRSFMKKIIDGNIKEDDNIEDFVLIPVDIEVEAQNSHNYGYSSQQQTVKKVTPQVSAPAMAKLDLGKAKIIATYSKKDFNN